MGLDGVKIVMEVEEAFDITVSDQESGRIKTPGELIDLVMSKVGFECAAVCSTQHTFNRLRKELISHFHHPRNALRPETSLDQIIPFEARRERVRMLVESFEINDLPNLQRSKKLKVLLASFALLWGIAAWYGLILAKHSSSLLFNMLGELAPVFGLGVAALAWRIGSVLTEDQRLEFPPALRTVGQLARWFLARNPARVGAPPGQWSRGAVSRRIEEIVTKILGLKPGQYSTDSRFVEDLGLD